MSKVKVHSVDKKEKYKLTGELFEIIANLKTNKEVFDFLFRLLTPSEILMIARRIQIAKLLIQEKNYEEITKKLKVSHQTINKVEQWLHGDEERSKVIYGKIKLLDKKEKNSKYHSRNGLLDKYAYHRFLKELF